MDAIELLTTDHQAVRRLFGQFQAAQEAEDENRMAQLAGTIFQELEVHTTIEEEIFYPAIRDQDEELSETVDESLQEHHVVDVLMNEMRDLADGSDEWVAKMTVLIENVEHHADEEEQEMFPEVREQLSADRLRELGDQMAARKETAKADLTTKADLYEKAKELAVEGRSEMSKEELAEAVAKAS
jgi:hemerythrin superfamily protein